MMSDVWCLSVAYIGPKSRTERPQDQNWHRGSPRHTWLGHHFQGQNVKGQGHQATLLTAAFTYQASAVVSMEKYSPWEPTATLPSAGAAVGSAARQGASAPTEGVEGRGHIVAAVCLQLVTYASAAKSLQQIYPKTCIQTPVCWQTSCKRAKLSTCPRPAVPTTEQVSVVVWDRGLMTRPVSDQCRSWSWSCSFGLGLGLVHLVLVLVWTFWSCFQ